VSGHEQERLSAYLDGELPPAERAAVEAHLAGCPECTTFLTELAAVDQVATALPAEASEGYFATFPARVRSRLEASKAQSRRRRLPTWTWALAAALLLAVVTPLTVRQFRPSAGEAPPPAPLAPPSAPSKSEPTLAEGARQPQPSTPQGPLGRTRLTPAPAIAGAPPAAPPAPKAVPRAAKDETMAESRYASEPAAPPPVATQAAPTQGELADAASAAAAGGVALQPAASRGKGVRERPRPAAAEVTAESVSPALSAAKAGPAVGASELQEPEDAFRRLETERPRSAAEWRRLRDDWNALAEAHPDRLRADEARVRAIVAGREAWLVSGDESDENAFRRDAASYLRREDGLQKPRVERLLGEPRRTP
jgi:anti-sigma factor RsiW